MAGVADVGGAGASGTEESTSIGDQELDDEGVDVADDSDVAVDVSGVVVVVEVWPDEEGVGWRLGSQAGRFSAPSLVGCMACKQQENNTTMM